MNPFLYKNGIETSECKCKCGNNLRLHTHIFGLKKNKPEVKFYADCPACGHVTEWMDTADKCLA